MNGAVCEIIERLHHGGNQAIHHVILHQDRGGFEADGQNRCLGLQIRTEVLHGGGTVCGAGIGT